MKGLLAVIILSSMIFASESKKLYEHYQAGEFTRACDEGVRNLGANKEDEKFISLYAFACLQADKIDRLALPIIMLNRSTESRKNAAYFSVILMQKNLLISALENHEPLAQLALPTTDYLLSRVFDLYSRQAYMEKNGKLLFIDPLNQRQSYRMYLQNQATRLKLVIEEYYDTILTKRHIYK